MKTSRLPTLPEEETSDLKSSDAAPIVREGADGKDDAAEVTIHKQADTHNQNRTSFFIPPSSSSSLFLTRTW